MSNHSWKLDPKEIYAENEYEKGFYKGGETGPSMRPVLTTSYVEEHDPMVKHLKEQGAPKDRYNAAMREALNEYNERDFDIYDDKTGRWLTKGPGYNQDNSADRIAESYPEPTK